MLDASGELPISVVLKQWSENPSISRDFSPFSVYDQLSVSTQNIARRNISSTHLTKIIISVGSTPRQLRGNRDEL